MNYQLAIWTALVSFLVVAPWIYTLTQENKRLRGKYRICSDERTKLAGENMEVRDAAASLRNKLAMADDNFKRDQEWATALDTVIRRACDEKGIDHSPHSAINALTALIKHFSHATDELYKYEHLAVTEAPKLGNDREHTAWALMNWIVEHAHARSVEASRLHSVNLDLKEQREYNEHQLDKAAKELADAVSNLETSKNLANCYLLSRNQARDDIQSILMTLIGAGAIGSQEQLDATLKTRGIPAPEEVRKAMTFADFKWLLDQRGLGNIIPSPKRRPRKAASGS